MCSNTERALLACGGNYQIKMLHACRVQFKAYTRDQLEAIIAQRLVEAGVQDAFEAKAIRYAAGKVWRLSLPPSLFPHATGSCWRLVPQYSRCMQGLCSGSSSQACSGLGDGACWDASRWRTGMGTCGARWSSAARPPRSSRNRPCSRCPLAALAVLAPARPRSPLLPGTLMRPRLRPSQVRRLHDRHISAQP